MHTWQYRADWLSFGPPGETAVEALDAYGRQGWELVSMNLLSHDDALPRFLCVFKRPASDEFRGLS
jgi:hypothetical protein